MKAETLQRVIDHYLGQDGRESALGEHLATVLDGERTIKQRLVDLSRDRLETTKRHMQENEELHYRLCGIQNSCMHWETTHHGDPAGGSAAYTSCDLCGKEL
jgi:hypothetical protein